MNELERIHGNLVSCDVEYNREREASCQVAGIPGVNPRRSVCDHNVTTCHSPFAPSSNLEVSGGSFMLLIIIRPLTILPIQQIPTNTKPGT